MNKLLFSIAIMMVTISSIGQNIKALDNKYGFREAIFEMPFDSFKDLVEVEKGFYKSIGEDLNLGEYVLEEVVYAFYKDQLSSIMIKTKGITNSKGVLSIFQQAYGKGYQGNRFIEFYQWRGRKVRMFYYENSATSEGIVMIENIKLDDMKKADEKKAASAAAKKL